MYVHARLPINESLFTQAMAEQTVARVILMRVRLLYNLCSCMRACSEFPSMFRNFTFPSFIILTHYYLSAIVSDIVYTRNDVCCLSGTILYNMHVK